jgi:hypothetical protein
LTTARSPNSLIKDKLKKLPQDTRMAEQRQHVRYQVEFPARFSGNYDGTGIVYNLGMGGCKVVSDLPVKKGARLTVHLQAQGQPIAITIQTATVQWTLTHEFGVEFGEFLGEERTRLGQFLATQSNIVP